MTISNWSQRAALEYPDDTHLHLVPGFRAHEGYGVSFQDPRSASFQPPIDPECNNRCCLLTSIMDELGSGRSGGGLSDGVDQGPL